MDIFSRARFSILKYFYLWDIFLCHGEHSKVVEVLFRLRILFIRVRYIPHDGRIRKGNVPSDPSILLLCTDVWTTDLLAPLGIDSHTLPKKRQIFQAGVEEIASGRMDTCAVYGFETMSHVNTWKGNE